MTRDPLKFFEYTNFYTGINPPPAEDAGLMALFQTAGVGPGSKLPDDPHLRQAIAHGRGRRPGSDQRPHHLGPIPQRLDRARPEDRHRRARTS